MRTWVKWMIAHKLRWVLVLICILAIPVYLFDAAIQYGWADFLADLKTMLYYGKE